jgi:hypothetical protein
VPGGSGEAVVTFSAALSPTGDRLPYTPAGGAPLSIPVQLLACQVSLGRTSVPWWQQDANLRTTAAMLETLPANGDAQAQLTELVWQSGSAFAAGVQVPNRVYVIDGQAVALPAAGPLVGDGDRDFKRPGRRGGPPKMGLKSDGR